MEYPLSAVSVFLEARGLPFEFVGSVPINGSGEDVDIAVLTTGGVDRDDLITALVVSGFTTKQHGYERLGEEDDLFVSYRLGDVNILVCSNQRTYERFTKGRDFCILLKSLGVSMDDKRVRVAIHGMVSNGDMKQVLKDLSRFK